MEIYVSGVCRWAKLFKPDQKYQYYGIEVKPTEDGLKAIQDAGITTLKPSRDGEGYYSFKRRPNQMIWVNREQVRAGAPKVYDAFGNETKDLVGNDSKVTVKLSVFPYDNAYGKGVSCRLEAVKVDELVPYEEKKQPPDEQLRQAAIAPGPGAPKLRIMF